jgi:hypothetical protein
MASLNIEQLDDSVLRHLSDLARSNHLSPEEQAKRLLETSLARLRADDRVRMADEIAAMTPDVTQTDSVVLLREDRSR